MCTSQQPLNTHVALHAILPLRKLLPSRPSLHPTGPLRPASRPAHPSFPIIYPCGLSFYLPRPSLYPSGPLHRPLRPPIPPPLWSTPPSSPPAHPSILRVHSILPSAWSLGEVSREHTFCECHAFLTRFSFRFFTEYLEWKVGSVYLQAETRLQMASKLYYHRRNSRGGRRGRLACRKQSRRRRRVAALSGCDANGLNYVLSWARQKNRISHWCFLCFPSRNCLALFSLNRLKRGCTLMFIVFTLVCTLLGYACAAVNAFLR